MRFENEPHPILEMQLSNKFLSDTPRSSHTVTWNEKSTDIQASFTLFKTFVGTGILAFPIAFKNVGLGLALLSLILIGIASYYAITLLLDVADDKQNKSERVSYRKLAFEQLGYAGLYSFEIAITALQISNCVSIFILTSQFLDHAFCDYDIELLCRNNYFKIPAFLLVTIPLSFMKDMRIFNIPGTLSAVLLLVGILAHTFYNVQLLEGDVQSTTEVESHLFEFNFDNLPLFFGVATFAFDGISFIYEVRGSMAQPKNFHSILKYEVILLTIIYGLIPALSLISLRGKPAEILFFSLPIENVWYLLLQILFIISTLVSYPANLFPALQIIERLEPIRKRIFNDRGMEVNIFLRYGLRTLLVLAMVSLALVAGSFYLFLSLIGSCMYTYTGFVLPVMLYENCFKGRKTLAKSIFNYVLLISTASLGILGFFMSLHRLLS